MVYRERTKSCRAVHSWVGVYEAHRKAREGQLCSHRLVYEYDENGEQCGCFPFALFQHGNKFFPAVDAEVPLHAF